MKPQNGSEFIIPQHTGDWISFPSIRQSLLGGKSINRFSHFVTSGAEDWVLKGTSTPPEEPSKTTSHAREGSSNLDDFSPKNGIETNQHFVDESHQWRSKLPPFRVLVHSPSTHSHPITPSFTVFNVTSLFQTNSDETNPLLENEDEDGDSPKTPTQVTVFRRFSHFVVLHTILSRRLPGIALPPLPEKQYTGRFNDEFVEARRGDLERYVNKIVRHPIARYAEIVTFFLACENDMVRLRKCLGVIIFSDVFQLYVGMEQISSFAFSGTASWSFVLCPGLPPRVQR